MIIKNEISKNKRDIIQWIQDKINLLEMHLFRYQLGQFIKLEKRLKWSELGINRINKKCKRHNAVYSTAKDTKQKHIAYKNY